MILPSAIRVIVPLALAVWLFQSNTLAQSEPESERRSNELHRDATLAGYQLVPNKRVPESFDAGFSMHVAAWPLLRDYPGNRFQTGLFGTWMFANRGGEKSHKKAYSDIEGGLGWWRDTRFATETPKFIMGGVAKDFSAWANGPGAGKGRDWDRPSGKYGVAQLSHSILWPPDGLNLRQGTSGQWFGYGYLPLPLTEAKATTAGHPVATGNQCWTLFLNTKNFNGPVAFFTPYFFSRATIEHPDLAGQFLDSRPADPNRALQMETQYIPSVIAQDIDGTSYARIAPTSFPRNATEASNVVTRVTAYTRAALSEKVEAWFAGGPPAAGRIDPDESVLHEFTGRGASTWRLYQDGTPKDDRVAVAWDQIAKPTAPDPNTFGFQWNKDMVSESSMGDRPLTMIPEFYKLSTAGGDSKWTPVRPDQVPKTTGLSDVRFPRPEANPPEPYVTPDDPASCWKTPGPVAGPFTAFPGDGSQVTYYWYRFADQPALLNADLSDAEREAMQGRAEKLHRNWKRDQTYLAPPRDGSLADIDPAMLVTPPAGLEVGFVPIVTRQELKP